MGIFHCWIGSEYDPEVPFHATPEFLYFYLIIIFIIIINIICFLRTGASLFSHWWQMRGLAQGSINELFRLQLVTVTKLFFIMGLPWTFDVISQAVDHHHQNQWKYNIRIALDILNLLTVITIFFS